MTTYKIVHNSSSWLVEVEQDHVVSIDGARMPGIYPWYEVREAYERSFCQIIPLLEKPVSVRFRGVTYELHWVENNLVRITDEDGRDLTWDQLPRQLKDALS